MDVLKSPNLSPRARILLAVARGIGSIRDIAESTGLSLGTVSKYISILVAIGLIEKRDRQYKLTNAGRKELVKLREELGKILEG